MKVQNKVSILALALFMLGMISTSRSQEFEKCTSHIEFMKAAQKNPELLIEQEKFEKFSAEYTEKAALHKKNGVIRVIPVVFHVMHEGGKENISKAQMLDQLRIMTEDYRRQNKDTTNTPAPFKLIAADCEIEFRLATIDPNGNPTDGITRTFTHLTNNASYNTQALIQWPPRKYLNMWVVKSIDAGGNTQGIVIGRAQFPQQLSSSPGTDGYLVRADFVGSIEYAIGNTGRTATHEIGHWLGLRHIWGDSKCGNDGITDTPPQIDKNFSTCPTFPHITNCPMNGNPNNGPNGDMYVNYMDYTADECMNAFSKGQKARMDATFINYRSELISDSNLVATGTDSVYVVNGKPVVDFYADQSSICTGTSVKYTNAIWNGTPDIYQWEFPGGTPSTASTPTTTIVYNTPGIYSVRLIASNGNGADTLERTEYIKVTSNAPVGNSNIAETFTDTTLWIPFSSVNDGVSWKPSSKGRTDAASYMLHNYTAIAGDIDELYSPIYDFTTVEGDSLAFWVAYKQRTSTSSDQLKVLISFNCGQTWGLRGTYAAKDMSTAIQSSELKTPVTGDWKKLYIKGLRSYEGKSSIRFKFVFTGGGGNNIFIDDINLEKQMPNLVRDLEILNQAIDVFPNPAQGRDKINIALGVKAQTLNIEFADLMGKVINKSSTSNVSKGTYEIALNEGVSAGVYFLKITVDGLSVNRKIVVQ